VSVDVGLPDLSSSSGQGVQEEEPLLGLEGEGTLILRNVGSSSSNDSVASQKTRIFSNTAVRTSKVVMALWMEHNFVTHQQLRQEGEYKTFAVLSEEKTRRLEREA